MFIDNHKEYLSAEYKAQGFPYLGRRLNAYTWACISRKDENTGKQDYRNNAQLFITISGDGIYFGFSYGDGDLGSPGQANATCDGSDVESEDEVIEDADPIEPRVGDIIFTELMLDPAQVADKTGEWVEMKNISGYTLDLSGFALRDNGKNYVVFPEGTLVEPFSIIVIG